ncbi:Transcriptional regulatory protein TcrA [Nocardioides dokdonensis FR1436]|uniref:Transcriptional regulatory protein TcrA n=1 Tax=Nocardioides dokdonensis FR1436 TaxID=1300347 RepID=A0A1A9GQ39_9ACTN|nr:response regulator transcription factor [Nocardioides dokdonensis]ANH40467.1 Transcriptional regulatory protein TcrA [Nocardioides dokdonensis FR1436]
MLIGLCEDDPAIRRLVARALESAGHEVRRAHDGGEATRLLGPDSGVDVIVMDVGLPDSDGRDVVQALRSAGQAAPVLFLTAFGAVHERIAGFHAGGDDYVTKPFDVQELLLRVDALGRRGRPAAAPPGGIELDPARHEVRCAGGGAQLTPTEYRMLAAITSRPGEVVRRRAVVAAAWPDGSFVSENTIDSFIRRIRVKLASIDAPVTIETVRGVGFRLS